METATIQRKRKEEQWGTWSNYSQVFNALQLVLIIFRRISGVRTVQHCKKCRAWTCCKRVFTCKHRSRHSRERFFRRVFKIKVPGRGLLNRSVSGHHQIHRNRRKEVPEPFFKKYMILDIILVTAPVLSAIQVCRAMDSTLWLSSKRLRARQKKKTQIWSARSRRFTIWYYYFKLCRGHCWDLTHCPDQLNN